MRYIKGVEETNERKQMYKKPVTDAAVKAVKASVDAGMRLRPALCKTADKFDCAVDDLLAAYEAAYPD